MVKYTTIIQAIENYCKSYSHKPHLADLPHDRRTNDPDKLQERIDAIDDRLKENKEKQKEVRQEIDDLTKEKKKLVTAHLKAETNIEDAMKEVTEHEKIIEETSEEFNGAMEDASFQWGEFYDSMGRGEQVPPDIEEEMEDADYYTQAEARYDSLTGEAYELDERVQNIKEGDPRDYDEYTIEELNNLNDDINQFMEENYYDTDNTFLYNNLFGYNTELLDNIQESKRVIEQDTQFIEEQKKISEENLKKADKIDPKINEALDKLDKLDYERDDYLDERKKTESKMKKD